MFDRQYSHHESREDRWEAELRAAADTSRESSPCPKCHSLLTTPSAIARTCLGAAGALAGAAGGAAEAVFRSGSLRAPSQLPVATLALATLAALAGATSGFTLGVALGQRLDTLLDRHRCKSCGHRYCATAAPTRDLSPT
jgi:hypothetical protein